MFRRVLQALCNHSEAADVQGTIFPLCNLKEAVNVHWSIGNVIIFGIKQFFQLFYIRNNGVKTKKLTMVL